MGYLVARVVDIGDSSIITAQNDGEAKVRTSQFLYGQPTGTYVVINSDAADPLRGEKLSVVSVFEVKTKVSEILAKFKL